MIVGIKTAHYAGPGVDAGRARGRGGHARDIPVMVDFGAQPARAAARRAADEEAAARRHLHPHVSRGSRNELDPTGQVEPGAARGPQARRDLRRRPRRRQLPVARRGAGDEGRLPARLDLDRPAHRQHERRHEGHAQRDEQVPGAGHVRSTTWSRDRRGTRRARSSRRRSGICRSAPSPTSRCCASRTASSASSTVGARLRGTQRLSCELTLRDGKVVYDLNGLAQPGLDDAARDYGSTAIPRWDWA